MDLTESDLRELATFFGRRIDVTLTPTPAPRTSDEERQRAMAWLCHLEEAQEQGRLSAIILRITRAFPDDDNLQQVCGLLREPGRNGDRPAGLVFLGAGAVGAVGLAAAAAGVVMVVAMGFGGPRPSVGAADTPALQVVGPVEQSAPLRLESAPPRGRCTREDGGLVGYWYAGSTPPGLAGEVVSIDKMVNVRIDYPDRHNDFDSRSHIECLLNAGDRVRLSAAPIAVPGGRYWIPLQTGDLLPEQTARIATQDASRAL